MPIVNPLKAERIFFYLIFVKSSSIVPYDFWSSNPLEFLPNLYYLLRYCNIWILVFLTVYSNWMNKMCNFFTEQSFCCLLWADPHKLWADPHRGRFSPSLLRPPRQPNPPYSNSWPAENRPTLLLPDAISQGVQYGSLYNCTLYNCTFSVYISDPALNLRILLTFFSLISHSDYILELFSDL